MAPAASTSRWLSGAVTWVGKSMVVRISLDLKCCHRHGAWDISNPTLLLKMQVICTHPECKASAVIVRHDIEQYVILINLIRCWGLKNRKFTG